MDMGAIDARVVSGDVDMVVSNEFFEHLHIKRGTTEYSIPLSLARILATKAVEVIAEYDARAHANNVVPMCARCIRGAPTFIQEYREDH